MAAPVSYPGNQPSDRNRAGAGTGAGTTATRALRATGTAAKAKGVGVSAAAAAHGRNDVPSRNMVPAPDNYGSRPEVQIFIGEMVAQHGFDAAALQTLFAGVTPNARTLALIAPPLPPPAPPAPVPARGNESGAAGVTGTTGGANGTGSAGNAEGAKAPNGLALPSPDLPAAAAQATVPAQSPAPPPRPKPDWQVYRARFLQPVRIDGGLAFWQQHADTLQRATAEHGVPPEVIVAIIGVETLYGRNTGKFSVLQALATLAFDYPARAPYFRRELEEFLLYCRENGLDPRAPLGSYAGAIGMPQFMPGSIRSFATDFDGNGRIDLIGSPVDVIGSVARFLAIHGWKRDLPILYPTEVAENAQPEPLLAREPKPDLDIADLRAAGFTTVTSEWWHFNACPAARARASYPLIGQ